MRVVPTRAVIVGINQHEHRWIPPLDGAVQDALDVLTWLITCGMPRENLRLLTSPLVPEADAYADRNSILTDIWDFLGAAARGSEVLVYIAAHGSWTAQFDRHLTATLADKRTQWETIVVADSRQCDAMDLGTVRDILRLEFRLLFRRLQVAKDLQITFVTDTCHSGDTFRNAVSNSVSTHQIRALGPGDIGYSVKDLLAEVAPPVTGDELAGAGSYRLRWPYVEVVACGRTEKSHELSLAGEPVRGVFTAAWLEALAKCGPDLSHFDIMALTRRLTQERLRTAGHFKMLQHPRVNGIGERRVFQPPLADSPKYFTGAQSSDHAADAVTVILSAGVLHGIEAGAVLRQHADWSSGSVIADWLVLRAESATAILLPLQGTLLSKGLISSSTPFVHDSPLPTLSVAFTENALEVRKAWLEHPFVEPMVREAAEHEAPELLVTRSVSDWVVWSGIPLLRRAVSDDPIQLALLLNQVAGYERFKARVPTSREVRPNLISVDTGVYIRNVVARGSIREDPLEVGCGINVEGGSTLHVELVNATLAPWFVSLYLLDDTACVAALLTRECEILSHETLLVKRTLTEWAGGLLVLKLIVCNQAINLSSFPISEWDVPRGLYEITEVPGGIVWATAIFDYG